MKFVLRETVKYHIILRFCRSKTYHYLCKVFHSRQNEKREIGDFGMCLYKIKCKRVPKYTLIALLIIQIQL